MMTFEKTTLWQAAFGEPNDGAEGARHHFRQAYLSLRSKAEDLVSLIVKDMPDYTVHDISHLDALWEVGSQIAGPHYPLNPAEGFVLGGAMLLHDAAMTLAAFPGGLSEIMKTVEWKDAVAIRHRQHPKATAEQLNVAVLPDVLRQLHAAKARFLPTQGWKSLSGERYHYLIDDAELRSLYGETIGELAESHWMPVESLESRVRARLGGFPHAPADWSVDVHRLACLLRVADAAHIDARRAPPFLRTLIRPTAESDQHWAFQGHLPRPVVEKEALVFTSGSAFPEVDAKAWWLCFDTINMINHELSRVDSFLLNSGRARFAARRVEGAESPQTFRRLVRTDGWEPVDARAHVSDVPALVTILGGEALYGDNPSAVVRELIQNAADAVRARRLLTHSTYAGMITVRLVKRDDGWTFEVEDNGVGMSEFVLTKVLLDFGKSLWSSSSVQTEFPGLAAAGLQSAGRFGIGFYSAFMLGTHIRVFTRRFDRGAQDQLSLEFLGGVTLQPILRRSAPVGYVENGGTCVSIDLTNDTRDALLTPPNYFWNRDTRLTLKKLVQHMCPCLDVSVEVTEMASKEVAVSEGDWKTISSLHFLSRLSSRGAGGKHLSGLAAMVRPIIEDDGKIVGRAVLNDNFWNESSALVEAGLRVSGVSRIAGVLIGNVTNAARTEGVVTASHGAITRWASEQAVLFSRNKDIDEIGKLSAATTLRALGVDSRRLPIVRRGDEFWTKARFISHVKTSRTITLVREDALNYDDEDECSSTSYDHEFVLSEDILVFPEILPSWTKQFMTWPTFQMTQNEIKIASLAHRGTDLNSVLFMRMIGRVWGGATCTTPTVTVGEVDGVEIRRSCLLFSRLKPKS